jgi:response regulator RpfG family c-di-GMP phosphodiesterase
MLLGMGVNFNINSFRSADVTANAVSVGGLSRVSSVRLIDAVQYLVAGFIFILYGVQVCPFLESIERPFFVSVVTALFIVMFVVRSLCWRWWLARCSHHVIGRQFVLDMSVFIAGGLALVVGNSLIYGFPLASGVRVALGMVVLGFLTSLKLALHTESVLITLRQPSSSTRYISITLKIQWFCLSLLMAALTTMLLLVFKDFEWLVGVGDEVSIHQASLWILYEMLFVAAIFGVYGFLISRLFRNNIHAYFSVQNSALKSVNAGERELQIPIISNDEFGVTARYTNQMIESLRETEQDLYKTRDATIYAISSLAETRDNETGAHIVRTQKYVEALGRYLIEQSIYQDQLTEHSLALIGKSAPLHDIGKVGIPDSILLKPGKLTDDEFTIMKDHPLIGRQAIEKAEEQVGSIPFLQYAKEISESHHEKWNGSGYPHGLKGQEIPLSGRLMALADVYDALITKRVYKPAFSHETSRQIIIEGRENHFDPEIVDAFIAIEEEFITIAKNYHDG